jgi:molybdenum cofactor guanylyltransferase
MYLCSGIILAGGASRRMGRDKAWIPLHGRTIIERVLDRLRRVCGEVILVTNDPGAHRKLGARVVGDIFPGKGSLGGIYSGLITAEHERSIVVACDMPFLNPDLLDYMVSIAADFDVVIPSVSSFRQAQDSHSDKARHSSAVLPTARENDLHPLHAVYSKECLGPIHASLLGGDLRMIGFHPDVRVRVVTGGEVERWDPDHLSMFNVNTPEDLALAESLAVMEKTDSHD